MPPGSSAAVSPPPAGLSLKRERWIVAAVLLVFVAIELNNINNLGFAGQDFVFHGTCTEQIVAHPEQWFRMDTSNRPLIYWIGGLCLLATKGKYTCELGSAVFLLLAVITLWLLHDSSRDFIRSPVLRLAAFILIVFLPLTIVTSVVYAPDGPALLPFVLAGWSLLRALRAETGRAAFGYALLSGLALIAGNFTKLTFFVLPVAILVIVGVWKWTRGLKSSRLAIIAGFTVLAPLLTSAALQRRAVRELADLPPHHVFDWHGTGELTVRSLLGVKGSDTRIFQAPGYWDSIKVDGQDTYPLLLANSYGYPALLHLAVFTDVMNCVNLLNRINGERRADRYQAFAVQAVRLGLFFSAATFAAVMLFWARTAIALGRGRVFPSFELFAWNALGLTWFLPLVLVLPFVHHAYDWGYWLPRLVFPSLLIFFLTLFATLDRWLANAPKAASFAVLVIVLLQTSLHLGSLCGFNPSFSDGDVHHPYTVLAHLRAGPAP
jgi:hypothetical protein